MKVSVIVLHFRIGAFLAAASASTIDDVSEFLSVGRSDNRRFRQHFENIWTSTRCIAHSGVRVGFDGLQNVDECQYGRQSQFNESVCTKILNPDLRKRVSSFSSQIKQIFNEVLLGESKGTFWNKIDEFQSYYDSSVDYLKNEMKKLGLKNIKHVPINVPLPRDMLWPARVNLTRKHVNMPHFPADEESSKDNPGFKITVYPFPNSKFFCKAYYAPIFVVYALDEIYTFRKEIRNKFLVMFSTSGEEHLNAMLGPSMAAEQGAVGFLTNDGMLNMVSEATYFNGSQNQIPAGIVKPEEIIKIIDALDGHISLGISLEPKCVAQAGIAGSFKKLGNLFGSLYDVDETINTPKLNVQSDQTILLLGSTHPVVNFLLYPKGYEQLNVYTYPKTRSKYAEGVFALQMLSVLKKLNLLPKRNVQIGLFEGSEMGSVGISEWAKASTNDLKNILAAVQYGSGCEMLAGVIVSGNDSVTCIVNEIKNLVINEVAEINKAQGAVRAPSREKGFEILDIDLDIITNKIQAIPSDMTVLEAHGVPVVMLNGGVNIIKYHEDPYTKDERWFSGYYEGKIKQLIGFYGNKIVASENEGAAVIERVMVEKFGVCLALMTSMTYVLGNLPDISTNDCTTDSDGVCV